jgi:archaemetzincin
MERIVLRPLTQIDSQILGMLKKNLGYTFNCPVEARPEFGSLDYAYDLERRQYLALRLLASMRRFSKGPGDRCLGIVDVDLYSPGLNFVFGEADIGSGVAIVSLYRLRPELYGLPHDEALFQERTVKEAVHELGHTYSLGHCTDVKCVMHFSNSLADTDIKGARFCLKCQQRLKGEKKANVTVTGNDSGTA